MPEEESDDPNNGQAPGNKFIMSICTSKEIPGLEE